MISCENWIQIPFWSLADVVLGSPEFNFSATLVNSQLVCLPPVGILNLVMFIWILIYRCLHWSWKAPMGSGQLRWLTTGLAYWLTTFVRAHEELVYFICSRTRSPRLWDVNCRNNCKIPGLYLIAFVDFKSSNCDSKGQSYPVEYYLE